MTREKLRSQIWLQDTFVDFDNGLNTAINKLREALDDPADNPRFVETLPRRGYRFLTPVSSDGRPDEDAPVLAKRRIERGRILVLSQSCTRSPVIGMTLPKWRGRQPLPLASRV